ncbi:hypothetical protein OM416_27635 [Paenibacillus sp. LS1]|uniref:hypothetical protein n=1 Tax=Paenibacillus sp. LS1 TaxID=2992120 RepID=UPI002232C5F3|nr:hypothetical protein [Paenibacillus sp. LS1]MCW3795384.1 hypothetical protein [Paenibacillus sp. LS1]
MLVEKATRFIKLVETTHRMEVEKDLLMQFRSRSIQLQELVRSLNVVSTSYQVMIDAGIECPDFRDTLDPVLRLTDSKMKLYHEQSDWILETTEFQSYQKTLKNSVEFLEKKLLEYWNKYIQESCPRIQQETLNIFEKISSFQRDIATMKSHLLDIVSLSKQLPLKVSVTDQLKNKINELHFLWEKFGQGNVSEDILIFLKQAGSSNGAPINLYTPSVIRWLEQNGILKHCTIRI